MYSPYTKEQKQKVFELFHHGGLTYAQIGAKTGVRPSTVRYWMSQAGASLGARESMDLAMSVRKSMHPILARHGR